MLPSDSQALRALLAAIFARQTSGAADADTAKIAHSDILEQTQTILSNVLSQWKQTNSVLVLPPEILAMCFAFLPFRCRVTASHVSRAWRRAALSSPLVWAEISHSMWSPAPPAALIQMAVDRAGTLPVHLEYLSVLDPKARDVLKGVIHRIGSLTISGNQDIRFLRRPAPVLEYLNIGRVARITDDFLGARVGRLKTLHAEQMVLPSICPALSTVTDIRGSLATNCSGNLFSLCPRLQSLSLRNLTRVVASDRFIGPAPLSLTKLELGFVDPSCDVMSIYKDCNTDSLREVALSFSVQGRDQDIGLLLENALCLRIEASFQWPDFIAVTAVFDAGRRHELSIAEMIEFHWRRYNRPFPPIFSQSAPYLARLRKLAIPITVLAALNAAAPPLPALAELRLEIAPGMCLEFCHSATPGFPWHLLRALSDVHVPHVILDVVCASRRIEYKSDGFGLMLVPDGVGARDDGLTASDARDMLAELAVSFVGTARSTAVSVCGFTRDVVQDIDIPECLKAYLTFDVD